jgi:hypothetical protein
MVEVVGVVVVVHDVSAAMSANRRKNPDEEFMKM